MKIKEIKNEVEAVKYVVEVDSKLWQDELAKNEKELAKKVKVEGFRQGHVPFDIAKKHISFADLASRSLNKVIEETRKELEKSAKFEKEDKELIEIPSVDVVNLSDKELELSFTYDVYPTVTVKDYKAISLPKNDHETVTDEEVTKEINKYLRHQKKVVDKTEGTLEKGDIAIFDFEGFKDGVPFAGGSSKNFELEIGTNQFVPGFEDQMVGMKIGETRELDITFPEDYQAKELAGAKTVFKVTLNGMKKQTIPELTEDFVKSQDVPGVKTIEEFKDYVKKQIQAQYDLNFQDKATNALVMDLVNLTEVSHIPTSLLDAEKSKIKNMFNNQLKQQGLDLEKYLKLVNQSEEQFNENLTRDAINSLKYALALEQIAKKENIEVTDDEVNEYLEKVAKVYNTTVDVLKQQLNNNMDALKEQMLSDKIIKQLIEWNKKNPVKKAESHDHEYGEVCSDCGHEH